GGEGETTGGGVERNGTNGRGKVRLMATSRTGTITAGSADRWGDRASAAAATSCPVASIVGLPPMAVKASSWVLVCALRVAVAASSPFARTRCTRYIPRLPVPPRTRRAGPTL